MQSDLLRMSVWFLLSALLYLLALSVEHPQIQTLLWKIGHVSVSAHLGYWASRMLLGRVYQHSQSGDRIARAIVIGAVMVSVSLGL
jgi:hypothetical protein